MHSYVLTADVSTKHCYDMLPSPGNRIFDDRDNIEI